MNIRLPKIAKALFYTDQVKGVSPDVFYDTLVKFARSSLAVDSAEKKSFEKSLEAYQAATFAASQAQIPVLVAAGNQRMALGQNYRNDLDLQSNALITPYTIAVGSSKNNLRPHSTPDHLLSSFSSLPSKENRVTLLAPGDRVMASGLKRPESGTSFSTPKTAAVVALMLECNPFLRPGEIAEILKNTATPLKPSVEDKAAVGGGVLSVFHALQEVERRKKLPKVQDPLPTDPQS